MNITMSDVIIQLLNEKILLKKDNIAKDKIISELQSKLDIYERSFT